MNWLQHDHKNFESAGYQCRNACDTATWSLLQDVFTELASSYKNHVRIEEEVLFPAYESHPGTSTAPTDSLKEDHAQIFNLMNHINQCLGDNELEKLADNFSLLYRILLKHHEKEEEIFLPMAGEALYSDKDTILQDLRNRSARDD